MRFFTLLLICLFVCFAAIAGAVDAAPVAAAVPVAPVVGFLDWFKQNTAAVLGAALALSELLSLVPQFQGNGILDSITKALRALSKPAA